MPVGFHLPVYPSQGKSMKFWGRKKLLFASGFLLFGVHAGEVQAIEYKTTLSGFSGSLANAINNLGEVVGGTRSGQAFIWNDGGLSIFSSGTAYAINDKGQIAGQVGRNAFLWTDLVGTNLGTLGGSSSIGYGISEFGVVVGQSYTSSNNNLAAISSNGGVTAILPFLGAGTIANASDINNLGHIVGSSNTGFGGSNNAVLWVSGVAFNLGTGSAFSINDSDQIVGMKDFGRGTRAAQWQNGAVFQLDSLSMQDACAAVSINNKGISVGHCIAPFALPLATLWENGRVADLNYYLDPALRDSGWILSDATGINDYGWITGNARNSRDGTIQAFLMAPVAAQVPESSRKITLLFGLAFMFAAVRYGAGNFWFRHPLGVAANNSNR